MNFKDAWRIISIVVGAVSTLQLVRSGFGFSLTDILNNALNQLEASLAFLVGPLEFWVRTALQLLRWLIGDVDLQSHWKYAFVLLWLFLGNFAFATAKWSDAPLHASFRYVLAFVCALLAGIAAGAVPLQHPSVLLWPAAAFFLFLGLNRLAEVFGGSRRAALSYLWVVLLLAAAAGISWLAAQLDVLADFGTEVTGSFGLLALLVTTATLAAALWLFGLPGAGGAEGSWCARRRNNPGRNMGLTILAILGLAAFVAAISRLAPVLDKGPFDNGDGTFKDCKQDWCPRMVPIPDGAFEVHGRRVTVHRFSISETEVTKAQFRAFVEDVKYDEGFCSAWSGGEGGLYSGRFSWRNPGIEQDEDHPVVCVSWYAARAYAAWLSVKTGQTYRLPSEVEWTYAASTGVEFAVPWKSEEEGCTYGNFDDCNDPHKFTAPVKNVRFNAFGRDGKNLYDLFGNVWEWVEDCDVGANVSNVWPEVFSPCSLRVLRGGSWHDGPRFASNFLTIASVSRYNVAGFRVARTD